MLGRMREGDRIWVAGGIEVVSLILGFGDTSNKGDYQQFSGNKPEL